LKLGGAAILSTAFLPVMRALADSAAPSVFLRGSKRMLKIALTYDDCYLVTMLQKLEKMLDQYPDFHVTLFPVGEALLSNETKDPGIWKRFAQRGHDIGYHSFNHDNLELFKTEDVTRDYDRWLDALQRVLGAEPLVQFARPPFGNVSPQFLNLCKERGLVCTMWSWGWGGTDLADVVTYNVPKTANGDIVLMHTRTFDMEVTNAGLPWLALHGIQAVSLRRLYYDFRKEQSESKGCDAATGSSLTRTCIE
jgi:peptidoglycan/xylan/chitin deacetylase (PgdA/CDA1 family)